MAPDAPLGTVAASECLLGERVRWDGDHNGDGWPCGVVHGLFRLVGICPEVGIGMGVPREPIRLVGTASNPRAVAVADPSRDFTRRLGQFAARETPALAQVHGYIFAARSPSCGLRGVKVFAADGTFRRVGRGVYAAAVLDALPGLPAVEAEALRDARALLAFAFAVAAKSGQPVARARLQERITGLRTNVEAADDGHRGG